MLLVAQNPNTLIHQRLTAELADVERRFQTELASDLPCVNALVEHVGRYRGKMLRPTLLLASGLACLKPGQELADAHRKLAVVVEMTHMATLVHDDILDDAQIRRQGATVNRLAGNETAVMLGDYLFSHAFHLCASLDDVRIGRVLSETTNIVCEGELLQLANRNNYDLSEAVYFDIIRRKTAALCAVSCRLGGLLADAAPAVQTALHAYGQALGVAFQITDDLLDLTGDQNVVGKTLGRDIQKGKLTLPLIHHLQQLQPAQRQDVLTLLKAKAADHNGHDQPDAQLVREMRTRLTATGSLDYADHSAKQAIAQAHEALGKLPASPAREFLGQVVESVIARRF